MKIKAVMFDLDGTLAESKQPLSKEMLGALEELSKIMPIAVVSGAGFHQFEKQLLSNLPENIKKEQFYIFPTNGAQCFSWKNGKYESLYKEVLSEKEKEKIVNTLEDTIKKTPLLEGIEKTYGKQLEDRGAQISFSVLGQEAPLEEKKKWDPENRKRPPVVEELKKLLPEFQISFGGMTTIDITKKGIDKAYAIEKFSQMTEVPVGQMFYVGDALKEGGNDYPARKTEINTKEVRSPEETLLFIKSLVS